MQALILAAGVSRRLKPLTDSTPKCLLPIGRSNLLDLTIRNIVSNGIKEFLIVTGYRENMIKNYINKNFSGLKFEFITNKDYENNNNSYSLWMTNDYVSNDILLFDSDILFDKEIIKKLLDNKNENCLAVNFTDMLDEEQIKVKLDNENQILKIGKDVPIEDSAGESIGIERFSSYFMKELFAILDRKILMENNVNEFYEVSFQEMIGNKNQRNSIYAVDVSEFECMEIDTIQDYNKAQEISTNK